MNEAVSRACGACAKRQVVNAHLQCRAKPPVADPLTGVGRWPTVRADDYCHSDFEPEQAEPSPRARRARGEVDAGKLPL